jgi:hypothetical protein
VQSRVAARTQGGYQQPAATTCKVSGQVRPSCGVLSVYKCVTRTSIEVRLYVSPELWRLVQWRFSGGTTGLLQGSGGSAHVLVGSPSVKGGPWVRTFSFGGPRIKVDAGREFMAARWVILVISRRAPIQGGCVSRGPYLRVR